MKLYKYYPDSIYSYKSLSVRGLWCHHPKNMNDPFECLGLLEREISAEKIKNIRDKFSRTNNPTIKKMLRFTDDQFKEFVRESRNRIISQYAFCSLSESYDDILMWSHYASSHTGFVLEFEFDEQIQEQIYKVKYKNELPKFDISTVIELIGGKFENHKLIVNDISIKSEDWFYEKEHRIWQTKPGYLTYPKESLKRIIFGVNTSAETKKMVMELMSDFEKSTSLVELGINESPLKLIEEKTYC